MFIFLYYPRWIECGGSGGDRRRGDGHRRGAAFPTARHQQHRQHHPLQQHPFRRVIASRLFVSSLPYLSSGSSERNRFYNLIRIQMQDTGKSKKFSHLEVILLLIGTGPDS